MLMSDPQNCRLLGPSWKPQSGTLESADSVEALSHLSDSSNVSPTMLPTPGSSSICPPAWKAANRRKVGGRLSMMDLPIPKSWEIAGDFPASVPFPNPSTLLASPSVRQLSIQIRGEATPHMSSSPVPAVPSPRESFYQQLTPEEEDQVFELNESMRRTLTKLEKETPSFSLREAICSKPSVPMRPPKKSNLMVRRSLGF